MIDTLETAHFAGLEVSPKLPQSPGAVFNFHPRDTDMRHIVDAWLALTFAVNSINRSMGQNDLYPFVLGPLAVAKLTFVQQRIQAMSPRKAGTQAAGDRSLKLSAFRRVRTKTT
jgi:hypothetical protein